MAKNTTTTTKGNKAKKNAEATEKKGNKIGKPALRILTFLAKAKAPATRAEICEKAPQDPAWIKLFLGFKDGRPGKYDLCEPGFVKVHEIQQGERTVLAYTITAAGRKALEKAQKEAKGK